MNSQERERMPPTGRESFQPARQGTVAKDRRALVADGAGGRCSPEGAPMTPRTPERTRRLQVFLSADEIAAIDDFRFRARMPNRAAAVRQLLMRGLASAKKKKR